MTATGINYIVYCLADGSEQRLGEVSAPVQSGDLTATRGVYRYGGGFPTASYKDTNYWVDLRFRPD